MEQLILQIIASKITIALKNINTDAEINLLITNLLNSIFAIDFIGIDYLYTALKNEDTLTKEEIQALPDDFLKYFKKETLIKIINQN